MRKNVVENWREREIRVVGKCCEKYEVGCCCVVMENFRTPLNTSVLSRDLGACQADLLLRSSYEPVMDKIPLQHFLLHCH